MNTLYNNTMASTLTNSFVVSPAMVHCDRRGCEVIVGDKSHMLLWEQSGVAQVCHSFYGRSGARESSLFVQLGS